MVTPYFSRCNTKMGAEVFIGYAQLTGCYIRVQVATSTCTKYKRFDRPALVSVTDIQWVLVSLIKVVTLRENGRVQTSPAVTGLSLRYEVSRAPMAAHLPRSSPALSLLILFLIKATLAATD